ncbi:MAG: glycosyltransferase family 2 protein [Spirosomataceae bacterium]
MSFLTIITITYNAEEFIGRTIASINQQVSKNFEYLLIDGNSKDKTLEIVNKHAHLFSKIVSEPDKGLYDAMNKGLQNATGEYVWFMNAGDEITAPEITKKLFQLIQKEKPDVIYGETLFTTNSGKILGKRSDLTPHKLPEDLTWKKMKLGMLVCHQSFIVRREIAPSYMKDNLSADIDWEIRSLKASAKTVRFDGVLANYLIGGISNQQLKKSLFDRFLVLKNHFGLIGTLAAHGQILIRGIKKMAGNNGKKYW